MRPLHPLVAVVSAALLAAPLTRADDPSKVDPAKRDESFAPPANATAPEKRELPRAEVVQDQRAPVPEKVDKQPAAVGDRRAAVDVNETREKTIIDKQTRPKSETKPRDLNRWNQQKADIQPGGSTHQPELVERYQSRMKAATTAASRQKPEIQKRTAFSSLNRFIFRRNQPEGDTVIPAGGAPTPAVSRP